MKLLFFSLTLLIPLTALAEVDLGNIYGCNKADLTAQADEEGKLYCADPETFSHSDCGTATPHRVNDCKNNKGYVSKCTAYCVSDGVEPPEETLDLEDFEEFEDLDR